MSRSKQVEVQSQCSAIVTLLFLITLLAGCGGSGPESETSTEENTASETEGENVSEVAEQTASTHELGDAPTVDTASKEKLEKDRASEAVKEKGGNATATAAAAFPAEDIAKIKELGLALHMHHDVHDQFPPTGLGSGNWVNAEGKTLLSWKVSVLPFVEAKGLYDSFEKNEPWNSKANKALLERMPEAYLSAGDNPSEGKTRFLVFRGKGTLFPEGEGIGIRTVLDGTTSTLMAIQVPKEKATAWSDPTGLRFDPKNPLAALGTIPPQGLLAVFGDGHVSALSPTITNEQLAAIITIDGGEEVNIDDFTRRPKKAIDSTIPAAQPPEEAARLFVRGLVTGQLDLAWQQLPPSDQEDIDAIVRTLATRIHPDEWAKLRQSLSLLEETWNAKKEFILGNKYMQYLAADPETYELRPKRAEKLHQAIADFFSAIAQSSLKDLETLKDFDGATFYKTDGPKIMQPAVTLARFIPSLDDSFTQLEKISFSVSEHYGDYATLNILVDGKPTGKQLDLVNVEGKWMPEEFEESGKQRVGLLRQNFEQLPADDAKQVNQMIIAGLSEWDDSLTLLLKSNSQTEFDRVFEAKFGTNLPLVVRLFGNDAMRQIFPDVRAALERADERNNMNQIGRAFHFFHDVHGHLPPHPNNPEFKFYDAAGNPFFSWRLEIAAFVDASSILSQVKRDELWDSKTNKKLLTMMPKRFLSAGDYTNEGKTQFLTFTGPDTLFPPNKQTKIREIRDGTSRTILLVRVPKEKAVPWTKPGDLVYDGKDPKSQIGPIPEAGTPAVFADGSIKMILPSITNETLRALITPAGGENVELSEENGIGSIPR